MNRKQMDLTIICALVTPFVKLSLLRRSVMLLSTTEEKKKTSRNRKKRTNPMELLASAFDLYNSQLVTKSLGVCGRSAFSQVQTF